MGMLLTCPIKCDALCSFEVFKVRMRIRNWGWPDKNFVYIVVNTINVREIKTKV